MSWAGLAEWLINWDPLGIYHAFSRQPPGQPVIPPGSTEAFIGPTDWGKIIAVGGLLGFVGLAGATYVVRRSAALASE